MVENYKPEPPKIHSHTLPDAPVIEIPPGKKVPVLKWFMTVYDKSNHCFSGQNGIWVKYCVLRTLDILTDFDKL